MLLENGIMAEILITGASGFLGSHIVETLLEAENAVSCVVSRGSDMWRLQDVLDKINILEIDYADASQWMEAVATVKPDAVIHTGWQGVRGADRNELFQFDNIKVHVALADACILNKVETFIGLGSQMEYGPKSGPISEKMETLPTTNYGLAKLCAFKASEARCAASGVRFCWARIFSLVGPKDNSWWLVPSIINSLKNGHIVPLTQGEQLWDFLHVKDAANAIISLIREPKASGVFNVGSGRPIKLREAIEHIAKCLDPDVELQFGAIPYREDQVMHLEANISKLTNITGWRPIRSLEPPFNDTIDYFMEN